MAAGKRSPAERRSSRARRGDPKTPQSSADPEVRMDKVEKIREAVLNGKYKVPASKVAARIMDDMRRK
jgi:flagellar biosynthesis anti-sigma factor FlgM